MSKSGARQFQRLVKLMARLRGKNGCPWDREQTHSSMKKYLIEEAYEVCDAIDSHDPDKLKEELGDFFFQVIFHSQIAKERGAFDIEDVLKTSYEKMVRRHPHVFGRHKASGPNEAYRRWQEKKDAEKKHKNGGTLLTGVPDSLPALLKAQKVSKRASGGRSEGPDIRLAIGKIEENLEKIKRARGRNNKKRFIKEIGDILLAVANLALCREIDAEDALNQATKKFAGRFAKIKKARRRFRAKSPDRRE